jgi:putative Mn2+ efflux pump MntP
MTVKLGFIILSIIGVLRIPEEFYLYKDKRKTDNTIAKKKKIQKDTYLQL